VLNVAAPQPTGHGSPVVAILDTGLGAHEWFPAGSPHVDRDPTVPDDVNSSTMVPVGLRFAPGTNPEVDGVTVDKVNGTLDPMAGHGTFIAGVVRQYCADAELVIVPVMYGDGAADETDLIYSLEKLLVWNRLRKEDRRLDVLTLSLGYYHETPGSVDDEAGLFAALRQLQRDGVCIVAAAGNGATTMEFWPAALATQSVKDEHGKEVPAAPLVSVGATNPSDDTVAAFSNTGSWVTHYRCGVAVVSTMPTSLDGSLRSALHVPARLGMPARSTSNPDDYSTGFGVWSGSSFSAPALAGQVAQALRDHQKESSPERRIAVFDEVVAKLPSLPSGGVS